jgi:hypothetical protein
MTPFESGAILADLQLVALGVRPAACGWIRATDRRAFRAMVRKDHHLRALRIGMGKPEGTLVLWCASRFAWAIEAHKWLDGGGRQTLGDFHLHWVQGLLYGYAPDEIAAYLARRQEQTPATKSDA